MSFARFFGRRSTPPARPPAPAPTDPLSALALLDSLSEGVAVMDARQNLLAANTALAPLLNRPPSDVRGEPLWTVLRHRELSDMVARVLNGGPEETLELTFPLTEPRLYRVRAAPVGVAGERGALLTFIDLTQTRRLENTRKEFVANVSHELKTPLTALRAALETLLEGALQDPNHAEDFLNTALNQVDRLQRLIEDLLALSRLEKPGATETNASCRVGEVARRVIAALSPLASKRNITLRLPDDGALARDVAMTPDELTQVLMNLCDNAIKFNRPGGSVTVTAHPVEGGNLRLRVADTGVGIPPEDQPRVFERFYRVDKARSKDTGGTGLGLSIVKHIVENRRGTLKLESTPDQGSVFEVILPPPPK